MADIPASRNIIQVEETKYKASVSEATMQRIGASINFIIDRIYDRFFFEYSGYYKVTSISDGYNGLRYIYREMTISFYLLSVNIAGSTSSTAINFDVYDENNILLGDLFSVAPSIASGAGNRAVVGRDVEASSDILSGANKVVGTLNYTTLQAGWSIVPKMTSAQTNGKDCFFELVLKEV